MWNGSFAAAPCMLAAKLILGHPVRSGRSPSTSTTKVTGSTRPSSWSGSKPSCKPSAARSRTTQPFVPSSTSAKGSSGTTTRPLAREHLRNPRARRGRRCPRRTRLHRQRVRRPARPRTQRTHPRRQHRRVPPHWRHRQPVRDTRSRRRGRRRVRTSTQQVRGTSRASSWRSQPWQETAGEARCDESAPKAELYEVIEDPVVARCCTDSSSYHPWHSRQTSRDAGVAQVIGQ